MKKAIIAVTAILIAAACFFAGTAVAQAIDGGKNAKNDPAENSQQTEAENDEKEEKEETVKKPVNVFFSPNTGDDHMGNATQWNPVKTKAEAKKRAKNLTIAEDEEIVLLEYLMTVDVKTQAAAGVFSDAGGVNMIPFTGSTDGYYFKGEIVGTGCDTQKYAPNDGGVMFSARYMLKGKDYKGQSCSIFIENNGPALDLCVPTIITDSKALADWQEYDLRAIVVPVDGGVSVNVYRIHND